MPRDIEASSAPRLITLAAIAVVIASLYFAREILVPLALAILLTFLLAPIAKRLERVGIPRIPAVILVVLLASGVVIGVGYLLTDQLVTLTGKLPQYQENIRHKIQSLRTQTGGTLHGFSRTIEEIRSDLSGAPPVGIPEGASAQPAPAAPAVQPLSQPGAGGQPIPVQVVEPPSRFLGIIGNMLGVLAPPLATIGICAVFVIFMLIQRDDLRDRIVSIMGQGRINLTTQALDDVARRISRYLLMQLIVNVSYGFPVGLGLYFIGLPNAALWGLLATLLRYLPYIGPWIAATMPILLGLAVFDDWWHVLAVIGLFVLLELIINNFLEPWLYGSTTGLSTVAVIVAAVFWGWLWGPVGLLLSTPMTACLVVISKHIPQLAFLNTLLGDEPVLPPQARFYQRLLAMDQEEASDLMEEYLEEGAPEEILSKTYDTLLLPTLHLAEQDRHRGRMTGEREQFVFSTLRATLDEIRDWRQELAKAGNGKKPAPSGAAPAALAGFSVLCVPVRDVADEIAAEMLAQFLDGQGIRAEHISATYLTGEVLKKIEQSHARAVCLSAVPPGAITYTRYLCKRLRSRWPEIPIVVGLWDAAGELTRVRDRMIRSGAEKLVTTFAEASETLYLIGQRESIKFAAQPEPRDLTSREGQADAA